MRILVAGGSGFLGTALVGTLRHDGHHVAILTRHPRRPGDIAWSPASDDQRLASRSLGGGQWSSALDETDVLVNLAGEPIADRRWTPARKAAIRSSRIAATRELVQGIMAASRPPAVFISSSAVGIYGARGDQPVTEETPPGSDFLASVCREWEAAALAAVPRTRVVLLRTGLVLARDGGALPQLARPFKFFAGGPLGSGRQYMSWIHREDWVGIVRWALLTDRATGPLNLTAPNPVTNAEMARTLGRVLRRPAVMPAPAAALRLTLGEMADAMILSGQRVLPAKTRALGFEFRYPDLEPALREIYA